MQKQNLFFALSAFAAALFFGSACGLSKSEVQENSVSAVKNAARTQSVKPDYTMTSEDFDKEFTAKGVKIVDLKKYAGKNIAVSGRVSIISAETKGTTKPWVTLFAPGVLHGVSCYFDDENLAQMKRLQIDKTVKVQGFQDDFIVPEVSPRLEHCIVLEAD